jgi:hypothetical protein
MTQEVTQLHLSYGGVGKEASVESLQWPPKAEGKETHYEEYINPRGISEDLP